MHQQFQTQASSEQAHQDQQAPSIQSSSEPEFDFEAQLEAAQQADNAAEEKETESRLEAKPKVEPAKVEASEAERVARREERQRKALEQEREAMARRRQVRAERLELEAQQRAQIAAQREAEYWRKQQELEEDIRQGGPIAQAALAKQLEQPASPEAQEIRRVRQELEELRAWREQQEQERQRYEAQRQQQEQERAASEQINEAYQYLVGDAAEDYVYAASLPEDIAKSGIRSIALAHAQQGRTISAHTAYAELDAWAKRTFTALQKAGGNGAPQKQAQQAQPAAGRSKPQALTNNAASERVATGNLSPQELEAQFLRDLEEAQLQDAKASA